jgi:Cu/Ag efflux protein CusF
MMKFFTAFALWFVVMASPALATEIDFATKILDLNGEQYRDCVRSNEAKTECVEWTFHTLGFIAFIALEKPIASPGGDMGTLLKQAQRGILARKVYPGKEETHKVDLSSSEITLLGDEIAKLGLRSVEFLKVMELIDPARIKEK